MTRMAGIEWEKPLGSEPGHKCGCIKSKCQVPPPKIGPGRINPVPIPDRHMVVFIKNGEKRVQPYIPEGRSIHVEGPRNDREANLRRKRNREMEQAVFDGLMEYQWLERMVFPNIHPAYNWGNSKPIQINGIWVRIEPYMTALAQNLRPPRFAPLVIRRRESWKLPCAQNHRRVRIGDSMINRLPHDPDWLSVGLPGGDLADILMVMCGRRVVSGNLPKRHEIALAAQIQNPRCQRCRQFCWNQVQEIVFWCSHNNFLRSVPAAKIHPPMVPEQFEERSHGGSPFPIIFILIFIPFF